MVSTMLGAMLATAQRPTTTRAALHDAALAKGQEARQAYSDFANMTMAEKIRYRYLASHGLTEEDLEKMDPKKREQIEKQIAQQIEDSVRRDAEKKTGFAAMLSIRASENGAL